MQMNCETARQAMNHDPEGYTAEFRKSVSDHISGCKPCQQHHRDRMMAVVKAELVEIVNEIAQKTGTKAHVEVVSQEEAQPAGGFAEFFRRQLAANAPAEPAGADPLAGIPEAKADYPTKAFLADTPMVKIKQARCNGVGMAEDGNPTLLLRCTCKDAEPCWAYEYQISREDAERVVQGFGRLFGEWDSGTLAKDFAKAKAKAGK